MTDFGNAMRLSIYTDEGAQTGDARVVDVIVRRARRDGLAGATALRGRTGFGSGSAIHEHHLFGIDDNPPIVVEIVDVEDRLRSFVGGLADLRDIGLITIEPVQILRQRQAARNVE
jgi:PII-like signaling protein